MNGPKGNKRLLPRKTQMTQLTISKVLDEIRLTESGITRR